MYCFKCGIELPDGAQFCMKCGANLEVKNREYENNGKREQTYAGKVNKCPCCGEILEAFVTHCSSCGYELRGVNVSDSLKEFNARLQCTSNPKEQAMLIRSFPVPNTKEDIFEFMVLASTNINDGIDDELIEAWQVKFEQTYQKANMVFKDDKAYQKIKEIYADTQKKIQKHKQKKKAKNLEGVMTEISPVLPNLIAVVGWLVAIFVLIPLCKIGLYNGESNSYDLILVLLLIFGTFLIPVVTNKSLNIPKLVASIGMVLSVVFLVILSGKDFGGRNNPFELLLFIDIICSVVIFVRMEKKTLNTNIVKSSSSFLIVLASLILFVGVFVVSNIVVAFVDDKKSVEDIYSNHFDEDKNYKAIYEWPEEGLSNRIPKPYSINGEIKSDSNELFKIYVYNISGDEFDKYTNECIENGFVVDDEQKDTYYKAFDSEGYKLMLNYSNNKELTIQVEAPMELGKISWPTTGIAKVLPIPEANIGKISLNSNDTFSVYIGDTTIEDFNEYVDKCLQEGFDYDYSRYDESFYGLNKNGDDVTVLYEGNNIMYISIYNWD